ncbi:alternative ribosome rescue factor ArfA [Candidatus Pelagibacter sp.]|nr:alternative ribosome rescue factor ArfA [Candidatus Pelagibacter sp.]
MDIKLKPKKNIIAKDLYTKKYKPRVIQPKKGKGSYNRKKPKA